MDLFVCFCNTIPSLSSQQFLGMPTGLLAHGALLPPAHKPHCCAPCFHHHLPDHAQPKMSGHLAGWEHLSSMLLLSGVAEGSSEIFNATLQHPRGCSSQPCSHPNPKPHHHGTSCPSSLARFLPLLVRVPFCAEQMGTSCLGTATLPSPRPCGKMHHRSREPSLPTL